MDDEEKEKEGKIGSSVWSSSRSGWGQVSPVTQRSHQPGYCPRLWRLSRSLTQRSPYKGSPRGPQKKRQLVYPANKKGADRGEERQKVAASGIGNQRRRLCFQSQDTSRRRRFGGRTHWAGCRQNRPGEKRMSLSTLSGFHRRLARRAGLGVSDKGAPLAENACRTRCRAGFPAGRGVQQSHNSVPRVGRSG